MRGCDQPNMAGGRPFVCKQERAVAVRKLDPEGARSFAHFSQAVLVGVPGPTLYVAGQGDVTGYFQIQARKAWTQTEGLLTEAGRTVTSVAKATGYDVDRRHVPAVAA